MEQQFLETYFGSNKEILSLARELIFEKKNKKVLRELSEAVSFFGTSDTDIILKRFKKDKVRSVYQEERVEDFPSKKGPIEVLFFLMLVLFVIVFSAVFSS